MTAILVFSVELLVVSGIIGLVEVILLLSARSGNNGIDTTERSDFMCTKKKISRVVAKVMAFILAMSLGSVGFSKVAEAAVDANQEVSDPVRISDSSLRSGYRVTYDTVFLGSYPQSEVKASDSVYSRLQATTNWNICGDTVIDGVKYRRIKQSEAIGCTLDLENWIYDEEADDYYRGEDFAPGVGADGYSHWEDYDTYHYFRYEPIRWRVLDIDNGKALLLSDIAIDARATDIYQWTRPADPIEDRTIEGICYQNLCSTWDNCELRSWLNSYDASHNYYKVNCSGTGERSFYNVAFSTDEKAAILATSLRNEGGGTNFHDSEHWEYTVGGRDTEDKVFLLSYWDVVRNYGFSTSADVLDEARKCNVSDYTVSRGLYGNADDGSVPRDQWSVQWGLRTATDGVSFWYGSDHYAAVDKTGKRFIDKNSDGSIYAYGDWVGRLQGVRPAMMIDLSSSAYSYAGTYCTDGTYSDGTQYSLGGCDHSRDLRHVDAEPATCDSVGHKEYWICDTCGKIFADEDGTIETTYFDLAIPKLTRESGASTPTASSAPSPTTIPSAPGGSSGGGGGNGGGSAGGQKPEASPEASSTAAPTATPTTKPSATPTAMPTETPEETPEATPVASTKPSEIPMAETVESSGVTYVAKGKQASVNKVKNRKNITIRKVIKVSGKTFKVTGLRKNLFAGKSKVKTVTIEVAYINSIAKGTFNGLGKGDVIRLKGTKKQIKRVRKLVKRSGLPKGVIISL